MARLRNLIKSVWEYLREVSGENDYARYCARVPADRGCPMSPEEFYVWKLRQKYSRISRCC